MYSPGSAIKSCKNFIFYSQKLHYFVKWDKKKLGRYTDNFYEAEKNGVFIIVALR